MTTIVKHVLMEFDLGLAGTIVRVLGSSGGPDAANLVGRHWGEFVNTVDGDLIRLSPHTLVDSSAPRTVPATILWGSEPNASPHAVELELTPIFGANQVIDSYRCRLISVASNTNPTSEVPSTPKVAPLRDDLESRKTDARLREENDESSHLGSLRPLDHREGESRFQSLANNMSQLAWMADPQGYIFWYNRRWFEYTGTTLEQMQGWGWRSVHHPDHVNRVVAKIRLAFETATDWEDTFPLRSANGEYRWFLSRMMSIRDAEGRVIRWLGTNTDITDNLRTGEESRRIEQKLSLGAAVGLLGLAEIDYSTNRMELTETAAQIYGFPPGTTYTFRSDFHALFHPDDRERLEEAMERARVYPPTSGDVILAYEHRIIRPDGEVRWISFRKQYLFDSDDNRSHGAVRSIIAARDITDQKELELNLRNAQRQAEVANHAKSAFLANMSHEIRSPMTAILGYAELLEASNATEREKIDAIRQNGRFLLSLLNDILDLSKIEADKMDAHCVSFSPIELVRDVASMLRVQATEGGLAFRVHFTSEMPCEIITDPIRLRQILVNLIGNAIKFTEQGSVELNCRFDPTQGRLQFDIIDTGCGIAPEHLSRLFLSFEQIDSSHGRRYGGTGLGLAISQRLAKILGGRIEVESRLGEGSKFSLVLDGLPYSQEKVTEVADALSDSRLTTDLPSLDQVRRSRSANLPVRVLIVDDRRDIRFVASQFIERMGGESITANNGVQAIASIYAEQAAKRHLDAVLMDVQMPEMDGFTAVRQLRAQGYSAPIIALTANALESDRDACLAVGFSDYVNKPIQFERLFDVLRKHCT